MATINDAALITTSDCTGPYWIVATNLLGDTLAWDTTVITFDLSDYLGSVVILEVKDIPSGTSCSGMYSVSDGSTPTIVCQNDTIGCTASLHPDSLTAVVIADNCGIDTVFYEDVVTGPLCGFTPADFIARVDRTWTVEDNGGNQATCTQQIFILRADTSMVVMPADTTLDCSVPAADTSITGRPTINGFPINFGGLCNINVAFSDTTLQTNCGLPLVLRRWVAIDACTNEFKRDTQIIVFEDITAPVVDCLDSVFYQTDIGVCNADIVLDAPVVMDDCSGFYVETMIPGFPVTTDFTFENVPKGMHLVTFTATDSCGNISAPCTTKLFVQDNETPTAICDGFKVIALPSNGIVSIPAQVFDDGSTDNCSPLVFTGSRDGVNFTPTVSFNCADAGDTVMVVIRVRELLNPNSFTDCMNLVWVQDKIPPIIICPASLTIECTDDYSDLSVFGSPFVFDACGYTLTVDSLIDIDNCGTGTIIRTFTATDPSGNSASCTQIITVQNSTPFNGVGIVWPLDTMLVNYCNGPANLGPGNLPAPYNFPVTPTSGCAMLATNYSDQFFNIAAPACYKIVRTWKVIDWCQYSPSNPYVGIWTHQQIIAVVDNLAPQIIFCPNDTTVGVGNDCNLANVVLLPVTATDCSPNLVFTNNSAYATSGGANASGQYPQGQHHVVFKVKDGCGNESTCDVDITVTDLKLPTPYCNTGIVTELQAMGGQIMASVQAEQFNDNSFDNCTDQPDLTYTIRLVGDPNPPTDGLVFDCDDEGQYSVEVWVTDEAGNSDFCVTNVFIQDNMNVCPFIDDTLVVGGIMVAGMVETMLGDVMPQVEVHAANSTMMDETDAVGNFQINGLQLGNSYAISPEKDDGPRNGVTTFDLALMSSHILGTSLLDSPYKLIAADVNRSGMVTTLDVVELRKLILHITDDFPNNTSWRFIPKDYVFPNPDNPFSPAFPEVVNAANLGQSLLDADFIGVKIGDMNANADPGFGSSAEERSGGELTLVTDDREVAAGEEITVPFKATGGLDLLALQFTIEFETDDLELRGIEKGVLPMSGEESFGQSLLGNGILTTAWFNTKPAALRQNDALFNLRFKVRRSGRLSEMLSMTARYTDALAYGAGGHQMRPNLEFSNHSDLQTNAAFQLYQNQPNPFKKSTNIGFTLPERGQAKLTVYDLSGRVLRTFDRTFDKGYNEVTVERTELPTGGVLFYQLETPANTATKKMILLQ
ncbi:MAG: HYR domain-containing protein [Bacteroidetes bacterium]|nr:HYR domain-containing protein [Bacteroidota bacterium]